MVPRPHRERSARRDCSRRAPQLPADPAGDLTGRLEAPPSADDQRPSVLNQILNSSTLISVLAVVLALVIGGILIAAADPDVQEPLGYFFARPGDFFSAVWTSVSNAYIALFQGAIYNTDADSVSGGLKSLTDTMTASVPLIFAGLGLGIGFRAGMFNIGAQGQIILGAIFAGYIGFAFQLPVSPPDPGGPRRGAGRRASGRASRAR